MKKLFICFAVLTLAAGFSLNALAADSGADLYKKNCASCHGQNAEKSANNTPALKTLGEAKINEMLNGYRNGTFGGSQKAMMERIVKKVPDSDLKLIAKYIGSLK